MEPIVLDSLDLVAAERLLVEAALVATGNNLCRAARLLGLAPLTLRRRIAKLEVERLPGRPGQPRKVEVTPP